MASDEAPLLDAASPSLTVAYLADVLAAGSIGIAVAPVVAAVDRAYAENSSGKQALFTSFTKSLRDIVLKPHEFFRSPAFFWMWMVFSSTYATANVIETTGKSGKISKNQASAAAFYGTTIVNTGSSIARDRAYARLFGTKLPTSVPMGSYAAWLSRDAFFMGFTFALPPIMGRLSTDAFGSEKTAHYVAQFVLPIFATCIGTPLHLLGLDIYNSPNNNIAQRLKFLKKDFFKNVGLAQVRQIPPWSFGTIGNLELRQFFKRQLQ